MEKSSLAVNTYPIIYIDEKLTFDLVAFTGTGSLSVSRFTRRLHSRRVVSQLILPSAQTTSIIDFFPETGYPQTRTSPETHAWGKLELT